jgi:hypothetical protein
MGQERKSIIPQNDPNGYKKYVAMVKRNRKTI